MFEQIIYEDIKKIYENKVIVWKKLANKKILITGANGFIVNYIINLLIFLNLEKDFKIKIFLTSRNKEKTKKKFINRKTAKFIKILSHDLKEKLKLTEKVDYIIHAASNASPKYYKNFPIETILPNVIGTYNLLLYASRVKVKSFIFFSSGEVYGNSKNNTLKEDELFSFNTLDLRSSYVESKKMGETLCYSFYRQKKVPIKILRIFHTYGPSMNLEDGRVMMDFVKNAKQNKKIMVKGDGRQKRCFCYISDLIEGIFIGLLKGKNGEAYNLSNNREFYSIERLAQTVSKLINKKEIKFVKRDKQDAYLASPFSKVYPSIKKILKLGFKPKVTIEKGFKRTIDYYKSLKE